MAELIQLYKRDLVQVTENGERTGRKVKLDIENLVLIGAKIFESAVYEYESSAMSELEKAALKAAQEHGADYVNCGYPNVEEIGAEYTSVPYVRLEIVALFYLDKRKRQ